MANWLYGYLSHRIQSNLVSYSPVASDYNSGDNHGNPSSLNDGKDGFMISGDSVSRSCEFYVNDPDDIDSQFYTTYIIDSVILAKILTIHVLPFTTTVY